MVGSAVARHRERNDTIEWRIYELAGISQADVTALLPLQNYCQIVFDGAAVDSASTQ